MNSTRSPFSDLFWYCLILVFSFAGVSCSHQTPPHPQNGAPVERHAVNNAAKYSFAEPKRIVITVRNQPRVTKAGKPVIRTTLSGVGIPFFTNYSTDQGLPINNIICSATDKAGNLWFGTGGGGISKYDGQHFTNYTIAQGLAGSVVFCIMEDKAANLWIGTTSGVSKYNGNHFTNYTVSGGLAGNFVTCIIQESGGNLWFGTHDGGVSKYDGDHFTNYTTAQGLAGNYVRCVLQDRRGNLWFGTDAGGVSKYDGHHFTNYTTTEGLGNNSVNCIARDNAGNLWFGTNGGASSYDGKSFTNYTTTEGLAANDVFCILQDGAGDLWFGTHTNGVSKYDGSRFRNYTKAEGLADNKINSIVQDRAGNLWIASQGGGVSKYEGNSFTHFTTAQGLANNLVFSMTQDKTGNLWFGTYEGGVSRYDGKSFANYTKAQGLPDISIWAMLTDKAGNVWFGSDRAGVSKYDGSSFTNYTTAQGLVDNAVISMLQDKAGNIWFGTRASGVSRFDGSSFTNYTTAQGLAGNSIWSIAQDGAGNIWFGTHEKGVSKYDGHGFTNYTMAQGLAGNTISSVYQAKNGNLWFGTDGEGVSRYDGQRFTNYTTEQGLADNAVSFIVEDQTRDIIWFGTNQGLSGFKDKPSDHGHLSDNGFENFSKLTGYPIKDVSTGGMLADNNGIVWVGSGEGKLIRFDYGALDKRTTAPLNLEIQAIKINNENICWNNLMPRRQGYEAADSLTLLSEMTGSFGKVLSSVQLDSMRKKYSGVRLDGMRRFYPVPTHLVLPHRDNNITIDFVAIDPALPKQVGYQYKLEGYTNDWSPLSNNPSAVFGNMGGGDYIFKLKAVSPFGVWSEMEYAFTVLPPWWFTWWAYALYGCMAGAIWYIFYRYSVRRIKRRQAAEIDIIVAAQEDERKRISRDLHDDIGARLTNMNILSALGQQKAGEAAEMSGYLKRISSEVQTSVEALDDIVWSIDTQNDSVQEATARMRRYAADVLDGTAVGYAMHVDEAFLPAKLSTGVRRDLFLVFKEAINNIQKHARASEVKINIAASDNTLLMEISDNGRGFDTDQATHRNGLKNIQQRIQKWGGLLTVQSSPGKGTLLKIKLPFSGPSLKKGIGGWFKKK
ncbi:MAG TPA: two-component regulator propeller domain-containing protein [Puia sp.]|nr:two-component regulator propeller domain-containing protein [Puia sp.]